MPKLNDLTGKRFGTLTVIERAENRYTPNGNRFTYWKCVCDCGKTTEVRAEHLKAGKIKTCGAGLHHSGENNSCFRHGHKDDRLYRVWNGMKQRCGNQNNEKYHVYGARGIHVCDEWLNNYKAFREWAYLNGYDENAKYGECTLDRIDVNGNYEPSNCRWVNAKIQSDNRRHNILITYNDVTKTRKDWAREFGTYGQVLQSLLNHGKSMDEIKNMYSNRRAKEEMLHLTED